MVKWMCLTVVAVVLTAILPSLAQDSLPPQRVEITAPDGLKLIADLTFPSDVGESGVPAVVLIHMYGSTRQSWKSLIPALTEAGCAALAVDLRGHGETGGRADWKVTGDDVLVCLDWLRQQDGIDPAKISVIGASIGANLALRTMAADEAIVTVIALSPSLNLYDLATEDAVKQTQRPIFLAVAQNDGPAGDVKTLAGWIKGEGLVRYYKGSRHGVSLLVLPDLIPTMVFWLNIYNHPERFAE
ncbi:MAG: alpha/beta fold hydrolase [Anaerolineae bacterium]|nr:alpha/beta fold hydrolase [Anaerolineae bacterium]